MEATVTDIQAAYKAGTLTTHQLVQLYLDRIKAYDQQGPKINSVITQNPKALEEADRLDAAFKASGPVGPLHGIPIFLKDQVDVAGLPTTLGSVAMKDYVPTRDAFVTENLKKAGAIILAKVTLGEMAGGDTYGSLFGVTRNPYGLLRTSVALPVVLPQVWLQTSPPSASARSSTLQRAGPLPGTVLLGCDPLQVW
jgi:amidase